MFNETRYIKAMHVEYLTNLTKMALPMLASSLLIIFTNLFNVSILGAINPQYFYLLGLYLPLYYLLICFFESARVCVIYFYAEKHINSAFPLISILLLLVSVLILLLISYYFLFPVAMVFYHVPSKFSSILLIFSLGMIAASLFTGISYLFASVFYAKSHSYMAFLFSFLTCLLNGSLTYCFSYYYQFGMLSLVFSTLISSGLSTLLFAVLLFKGRIIRKSAFSFLNVFVIWIRCFKLATPVFISFLVTFLGFSLITQIVSNFGKEAVAGFGVALRVQAIIILPAISIAISTAVFYRREESDRKKQLDQIKKSFFCIFLFYAPLALAFFVFRNQISDVLVKDPSVRHYCIDYLKWVSLSYLGFGSMLFYLTLFEQIGLGKIALLFNTLWFLVEIFVGGFFALNNQSINQLFLVIAIMNFLSIPTVIFFLLRERLYGFIKIPTT